MNAHSRDSFDYQLTDDELDAILANTHCELLAHVEQVADPSAALIAIMVDSDESELRMPDLAAPIPRHIVAQRLRALIETRYRAAEVHQRLTEVVHRARNLARDLDRELSEGDLTIAVLSAINFARRRDRHLMQLLSHSRDLAVQIAYDTIRIRKLDRDLSADKDAEVVREHSISEVAGDQAFDGIRELDRYFAHNRQLIIDEQIKDARELSMRLENARRLSDIRGRYQNLDRQHAHELALAIDIALDQATELANAVLEHLDAVEVNAVAADLSQIKIHDPAILAGVIWAETTIWPSDIAEHVESLSEELVTGIYQIRPDGQRPAVQVGREAIRQMPIAIQSLFS